MEDIPKGPPPAILSSYSSKSLISMVSRKLCEGLEGLQWVLSKKKMFQTTSIVTLPCLHWEQEPIYTNMMKRCWAYTEKSSYFPDKLNLVQSLEHVGYEAQFDYTNWCFQNLELSLSFLHGIISSKGCVFNGPEKWKTQHSNLRNGKLS